MEAKSIPASAVGGDFYDFLPLDSDRIAAAIGDVSGKGVPAALFMAKLIGDLRFAGQKLGSPEAILTDLNLELTTQKRRGMFVSAQYLLLHAGTGEARVSNGGHVPFLWYHRQTGEAEVVEASAPTEPALIQPILRAVEVFTAEGRRHDDLTLVQVTWC